MIFLNEKNIIAVLLSLSLVGCGGDGDSGGSSSQEEIAINAQDLLSFSPTKNTQIIDLRQKVTAEDSQDLIIENIESIDNNCAFNENDINGLTFKVTTNGANVCRFKYHVKPQSSKYIGTSEAIVQVVVTDDYTKGDFLPPISRTITESGSLTLDSTDLLIEDGFEIDPSSIYLIGETTSSDIGSFSADASSITYQAPVATTGTVRIFYTEIDSINNVARPGVVYIAIGQKGNHSPIARNERLETVTRRKKDIPIDISSFIHDDDGDELQLIEIRSVIGRVEIDSPHSFLYTPGESGREVVTYIISDHNGGYGIGTLIFDVDEYKSITDTVQGLIFSPPLTINQLSLTGGIYTNTFKETGFTGYSGIYPTFEKGLAEAYCATKGMQLAKLDSLKAMRTNVLAEQPIFHTEYQWHSGIPFLTQDGANVISLETGRTSTRSDGYFSCMTDTAEHSWSFTSPEYPGLFNTPTNVYITAKTGGESIFLPTDKYNLAYEFSALSINGELVDPSLASTYLTVSTSGNTITVTKKNLDSAVAATLNISDPITTSTTKLILGVSLCPLEVTPEKADELSCILVLHGKDNEAFSAALSHNMLTILGMKEDQINALGDHEIGKGATKFRAIQWAWIGHSDKPEPTSDEQRQAWLDGVKPACDALTRLKLDGRTNWVVGADNIEPIRDGSKETWFSLSREESRPATAYVKWMMRADGGSSSREYGLGYANADATGTTYINQMLDNGTFKRQSTYQDDTNTFPSCWSKN